MKRKNGTGTIIMHSCNGCLYWSDHFYHHAPSALSGCFSDFTYITDNEALQLCGNDPMIVPVYPNEYALIENGRAIDVTKANELAGAKL